MLVSLKESNAVSFLVLPIRVIKINSIKILFIFPSKNSLWGQMLVSHSEEDIFVDSVSLRQLVRVPTPDINLAFDVAFFHLYIAL